MKKYYYLAYGSNLNIKQMKVRCETAKPIGTAVIKDYEFLFKGSLAGSYLTIEPRQGEVVPVGVWEVTKGDIGALDRYEGFPNFYYKVEMKLPVTSLKSGKTQTKTCFVYIMNEDRELGLPSRYYVQTCLEGYADFGFDDKFLEDALSKSGRKRK